MTTFNSQKYPISPITDEKTYLNFCDWIEELDDLSFESEAEEDKKLAYLDALTTLVLAYENKHFSFNQKN